MSGLPNAKDHPDQIIKFLRVGAVAINFMIWSRVHHLVGRIFRIVEPDFTRQVMGCAAKELELKPIAIPPIHCRIPDTLDFSRTTIAALQTFGASTGAIIGCYVSAPNFIQIEFR